MIIVIFNNVKRTNSVFYDKILTIKLSNQKGILERDRQTYHAIFCEIYK